MDNKTTQWIPTSISASFAPRPTEYLPTHQPTSWTIPDHQSQHTQLSTSYTQSNIYKLPSAITHTKPLSLVLLLYIIIITTTMSDPTRAAAQQFVHNTLAKYPGEKYIDGWAEIWNTNNSPPWDKGFPNPALEDILTQQRATIGGAIATDAEGKTYRKKALVPGCGRGVDVLLLASFGYDAYGLEYSGAAIEACRQEKSNGDRYPVRDAEVGRGEVVFVQGDFFKDDWLKELGLGLNCFDLVYDYTVSIETSLLRLLWVLAKGA